MFVRSTLSSLGIGAAALMAGACATTVAEPSGELSEAALPGVASAELEAPLAAQLGCAELATSLALPGLIVTQAQDVPASSGNPSYPTHCLLTGKLDARQGIDGKPYAIGFELRMPKNYRGRFFFQGGAGTDGVIDPAFGNLINTSATNALTLGYAVASTDGGHDTGRDDVSFGLDPQARIDYGYNAVGRVTSVGKAIIREYYGRVPRRSYFVGCSNGGRQAMVAAARFGDQFDGILAAAPGTNLPKAALAQAWDTQQFMTAASPGQLPKDAFPPAVLSTVGASILARCDSLDGLVDGMVQDLKACQRAFDLERDVLTCAAPGATGCVSAAQKSALRNIFNGVKNSRGESLYSTWSWDFGLVGGGWRFWKLDAGFAPLPFNTLIGSGALGYVFTTPPDQPNLSDGGFGYQLGFNFDLGGPKIFSTNATFTQSAMQIMTPPHPTDLKPFKKKGKLIVVHGASDPVFSSDDTIAWYRSLLAADSQATSYAKVFIVPGMNHCAGGPATERFNLFAELERWVESGVNPSSVIASVDPANPDVVAQGWSSTRTRPLCAYPKRAIFTCRGGDPEDASSFSCQ